MEIKDNIFPLFLLQVLVKCFQSWSCHCLFSRGSVTLPDRSANTFELYWINSNAENLHRSSKLIQYLFDTFFLEKHFSPLFLSSCVLKRRKERKMEKKRMMSRGEATSVPGVVPAEAIRDEAWPYVWYILINCNNKDNKVCWASNDRGSPAPSFLLRPPLSSAPPLAHPALCAGALALSPVGHAIGTDHAHTHAQTLYISTPVCNYFPNPFYLYLPLCICIYFQTFYVAVLQRAAVTFDNQSQLELPFPVKLSSPPRWQETSVTLPPRGAFMPASCIGRPSVIQPCLYPCITVCQCKWHGGTHTGTCAISHTDVGYCKCV